MKDYYSVTGGYRKRRDSCVAENIQTLTSTVSWGRGRKGIFSSWWKSPKLEGTESKQGVETWKGLAQATPLLDMGS